MSAPLRISLLKRTDSQGRVTAEEMTRDNSIQFGKAISQAATEEELNIQGKSSLKDLEKQLGFNTQVSQEGPPLQPYAAPL